MPIISNSPQEVSVIEAEARKSLSLGLWIKDSIQAPVDLTSTETTLTVAKLDRYGIPTVLFSSVAEILSPTLGYARFKIQAADLNVKPATYVFSIVLVNSGYSIVLAKGDFVVLQNTEFASVGETYTVSNPTQAFEVLLRDQADIHLTLSAMLPPDVLRIPAGGNTGDVLVKTGPEPDDIAWGIMAGGLSAVGQANFKSPTASGLGTWSWRDTFAERLHLPGSPGTAAEAVRGDDPTDLALAYRVVRRDANSRFSIASPTVTSHAATKGYVDGIVPGLLTTKGDLLTRVAANPLRLPVGTNGQVLTADSADIRGIKWATPTPIPPAVSGFAVKVTDWDGVITYGAYYDDGTALNSPVPGLKSVGTPIYAIDGTNSFLLQRLWTVDVDEADRQEWKRQYIFSVGAFGPWEQVDGPKIKKALLPVNARSGGKTKVKVNGVLSTTEYPWLSNYSPQGSREVRLLKDREQWYISGQVSDDCYDLTLATNWYGYGTMSNDTTFNERITIRQLPSGLAVCTGLLRSGVAVAGGTTIATFPAHLAPSHTLILPVIQGDLAKTVEIRPDGQIVARAGFVNSYLSLDGLAWWPAGTATWTDVGSGGSAWGAGFGPYPNPETWGTAGFYKDPYGFVWAKGLVQVTVASPTDNKNMISLPATHRVDKEQHVRAAANDDYGSIGAQPGNGINWKPGSPGTVGAWISLSGSVWVTAEALSNNPWYTPNMGNSWIQTSASFPWPGTVRREDGLCLSKGLISSGTLATRAMVAEEEAWPTGGRIIIASSSNATQSRLDIGSIRDMEAVVQHGGLVPRLGSNSWWSLDGLKWVP
ncbi:minor tail protein [Microbacterium phage EugeneKrabs]|nr:minor tail protein [Microbacterium phage EugeneKrabs]